jgi:hypothetical protein
LISRSWIAA